MTRGLLDDLDWRGLLHQATPGLAERLGAGSLTAYAGFDPTAPSLQLGNLVAVMLLAHLQRAGHRPIAVVGGGTAMIGDPSGKSEERPLLSPADVDANAERMRRQLERFLEFSGPAAARMCNNADWLRPVGLIDFLRNVGKHFPVNLMLQKESVRARLAAGISYTEFSYMLLQAWDFLHLFRTEGCVLQVGGSDQWGNITAGIDLIRRVTGSEAHGLCAPLITTAQGAKFGKTAGGAVWLDPDLTSVYRFYQFWLNVDDRDIEGYVKRFTLLDREAIGALLERLATDPGSREAHRALARAVTEQVHGPEAAVRAEHASQVLFGGFDPRAAGADIFAELAREIPVAVADQGAALTDVFVATGLASSKGDARRAMTQGGAYLNQRRIEADRPIASDDWLAGGYVLLRKGAKQYALVRAAREGS